MKAALFALSAGSLVGSAFAIHARHAAFHNKRGVAPAPPSLEYGCCKTVVTVTVYAEKPEPTTTLTWTSTQLNVVSVTATSEPCTDDLIPPPASAVPQPPASAIPKPPANAISVPAPPPVASAPASAPAYAVPSAAPSVPGPGVITNGNKWAMTYTPYNTDGTCRGAVDVLADLTLVKAKGFTTVRLYGTDCDGLKSVGDGCRAVGLKLILGIFIKGDGIEAARPQIGQITKWGGAGNWDLVVMLVVGNEAIHSGFCDASSLAKFIGDAKSALTAAGQGSIPVTTTEVVSTLGASKDVLCPVIDVVAANIQSFFDGKVEASKAGDFVVSQLEMVAGFCPGKPHYNMESGWPSGGGDNGASQASPDAQKAAIADIVAKAGDKSVIFSFKNDGWKGAGIEQHFGCSQLF